MQPTSASQPGSTPGSSLGFVDALTTTHLIVLALVAVIVVLAMIYGARLKRRRSNAQRQEERRLDRYDAEHPGGRIAVTEAPAAPDPAVAPVPAPVPPATTTRPVEASPAMPFPAGDTPADGPVTQLKGLGPKVAARLAELGITSVGQIAALDDDAADALDARLGAFQGRIARDRWVEQARFLAAGDRAGFEAVFGRL